MSQAKQGVDRVVGIAEGVEDGEERLRKLLRDVWYAGPLKRGSKPYRSPRNGGGSPGSDLRRSRDGALWGLPEHEEDAILGAAVEAGLIRKDGGAYSTTEKGREMFAELNRCAECGREKEPHHHEESVRVGTTTEKNHSLTTKCPECSGGAIKWDRDNFPATSAGADDAERFTRSFEGVELFNAGSGEWKEPHQRALEDFIEAVNGEMRDVDRFRTRYSTPTQLMGAEVGFRAVFDMYTKDVCEKFADLLLDTYYGQSLSTLEQAIVEQIATGYPEKADNWETHQAEYGEPIAASPDTYWEATIKTIESDEYVTISDGTKKARGSFTYETRSGAFRITLSNYKEKRVYLSRYGSDLFHIGTVVGFEVEDKSRYKAESRVERAVEIVEKHVEKRNEPGARTGQRIFCKLANNESVTKTGFGSGQVNLDLNGTELIKTARVLRQKLPEKETPGIIERYAEKTLK